MNQFLIFIALIALVCAYRDISEIDVNIEDRHVTVSGISSGGFMAVQFHVAFSSVVKGSAVTAGGPYYCAENNVFVAQEACQFHPELILVNNLIGFTESFGAAGTIDSPRHLEDSRVWLFSGTKDTEVVPGVVKKLESYYAEWVPASHLKTVFDIPAVHSQVTNDYGAPCQIFKSPYIVNCGFDSVGDFLPWILNETLNEPVPVNNSNFFTISQAHDGIIPSTISMSKEAFAYVPSACQTSSGKCHLHIAFHGCNQGFDVIGKIFIENAGYNKWAEANNIIVLYPQITPSSWIPFNPKGCWDFWGYTDPAYPTKLAPQMIVINTIISQLMSQ